MTHRMTVLLPLMIVCLILVQDLDAGQNPLTVSARQAGTDEGNAPVAGPGKQQRQSILKLGVHVSDIGRLDPHFAAGSQDRAVADMVFNGLLRYQPGNAPVFEPDLAEKLPEFTMKNSRQIWTITLRQGVFFHPGPDIPSYELTADDVLFSLNKSADSNHSAYAGDYAGMSVEKTGRYTLTISLDNPLSPVLFFPKLTNYAGGFIVSRKAIQRMGYDGFAAHPVGTGPFVFQEYLPGEKVVLASHDNFFRGRPLLDGVEVYLLPDPRDRETRLIQGELDVITGSGDREWYERMKSTGKVILDTFGVGEVGTVYLNTSMKPMDDIRVRKAIALALDRQGFLDTTGKEITGPVYSPVPATFLSGGLTESDVRTLGLNYETDPALARTLLAEAGYPDGFTLDLVCSEKRLYRQYYLELKRQLSAIGILCNVTMVSHAEMHKQIRDNPRPLVIYVAWRPNADAYLTRFFHSDSIIVTGARPDTNFSHYTHIDSIIEAARLEIDPTRQISLWVQAQIRILNDMAAYPIMYTRQLYARALDVDYGHPLVSTMALYPQFTEKTSIRHRESNRP